MLVKFEQNRIVQTTQKSLSFLSTNGFFKSFSDKALAPFGKRFLKLKRMFNAKTINLKTTIFLVFQKITVARQVKTRLKVAPNIPDPISVKDSDSSSYGLRFITIIYTFKVLVLSRYFVYHMENQHIFTST